MKQLKCFTLAVFLPLVLAGGPISTIHELKRTSKTSDELAANAHERALTQVEDRLDRIQEEISELRSLNSLETRYAYSGDQKLYENPPGASRSNNKDQETQVDEKTEPATSSFTAGSEVTILFHWFNTDSWEAYGFALIVTLFLGTILEFMSGYCQQGVAAKRAKGPNAKSEMCSLVCKTLVNFFAAILHYSVILIVTTYDAGLFLAACGGSSIGYCLYNWVKLKSPEIYSYQTVGNSSHGDEPSMCSEASVSPPCPKRIAAPRVVVPPEREVHDIEMGIRRINNTGALHTYVLSRLEPIREDERSSSCGSTDGSSQASSNTKMRIVSLLKDEVKDETESDKAKNTNIEAKTESDNNTETKHDGNTESKGTCSTETKDDSFSDVASLPFTTEALQPQQDDEHSCWSVQAAIKRDDDEQSIGNNMTSTNKPTMHDQPSAKRVFGIGALIGLNRGKERDTKAEV